MANRFWVGGTGNTDDTGHWSTTSGGGSGASVPTSADNATWDANSGTGTVTFTASFTCLTLNTTAALAGLSFAGAVNVFVHGSFLLGASHGWTFTGSFFMSATTTGHSVTFNGTKNTNFSLRHSGAGGGWTFTDNATLGNAAQITLEAGTLTVSNRTIDCGLFTITGATTRVLNATSTTWLLRSGSGGGAWQVSGSNYTLNLSSTSITLFSAGRFLGAGLTYQTVSLTNSSGGTCFVDGANTYTTLSLLGSNNTGGAFSLSADQIVTGTLKYLGFAVIQRMLMCSNVIGTARTITAAAIDAGSDFFDFMDITAAGAGSPFATGSSLGNCLGNSNITFTAAATQFWKTTTTGSKTWSTAANWFLATNGGGGAGRVPLPQDDVVFDANSIAAGAANSTVISTNMPRSGKSITFAGVTPQPQINLSATSCFGSLNVTGTFVTNVQGFTFAARSPVTLTSGGNTFGGVTLSMPGGTLTLSDSFAANATFSHGSANSTFDANGFNFTLTGGTYAAQQTGGVTKMGAGTWTINTTGGGNVWVVQSTVQPGTSTLKINVSGETNAILFQSAAVGDLNNLWTSGAGGGGITLQGGSLAFNQFKVDTGKSVVLTAGNTYTAADWQVKGTIPLTGLKYGRIGFTGFGYFSTPDSAANSITGDIDLRFKIAFPVWSTVATSAVINKSGGTTVYQVTIGSSGTIFALTWRETGGTTRTVNFDAISATSNYVAREFRVTLDVDNGSGGHTAKLEEWLAGSWTQVGATKNAGAFTTSIQDSTDDLAVGAAANGTTFGNTGMIVEYAEVRNGIAGAVVNRCYPEEYSGSGATWVSTSPQAETWTRRNTALIAKAGQVRMTTASASAATVAKSGGGAAVFDSVAFANLAASAANTFFAGSSSYSEGGNTNWVVGTLSDTVGTASGVATVDGVGRAVFGTVGLSVGSSPIVQGEAQTIATTMGLSQGVATVDGVGFTHHNYFDTVGTSNGFATVQGQYVPIPSQRIVVIHPEGRLVVVNP